MTAPSTDAANTYYRMLAKQGASNHKEARVCSPKQ
jgi:hypothetical protein